MNALTTLTACAGLAMLLQGCGPSNYEECILDNMENAANAAAAYQIRMACKSKFGVSEPDEKKPVISVENEYLWERESVFGVLENIKINEIPSKSSVKITNSNSTSIKSITLSNPLSGTCDKNKSNYTEFITCRTEFFTDVEPMTTKTLHCSPDIKPGKVCLVGVSFDITVYPP